MVDSDDLYGPMEVDDDLSTALGAETLADRNMVPPGFDNTPGSSADTLPIDIFEHRRFLRAVIPVTEVNLARAPRALEGEVRGGSSLEGAGKRRLWRKGSRKGVEGGRWR
jgi:hypothetical protein